MAPIVRSLPSYVKDSQHALQIFRDFNFLGEKLLWILHPFTPSSLMASPQTFFLIYALLRNQARKHCSVWLN